MISREALESFVQERRIQLIVITGLVLLLLILVLILALIFGSPSKPAASNLIGANSIPPEDLWLPQEPLPVPGAQFFRESRTKWSLQEVKEWYTIPDEAALEELRLKSRSQIERILESAP